MERVKGIEPSSQAWEARILPLNHTRLRCVSCGASATFHEPAGFSSTRPITGWQLHCEHYASMRRRLIA